MIQEALSAGMSSLHVDDSLSGRVEFSDDCRTMIVTPDGDEVDKQRIIDDSAVDSDYDDVTVANPTPKSLPKNIRNKKSKPKLTLDHNFMCFLRPHKLVTNCSAGERRTFILSPRWNDSMLTIAGNFTLIFRQHGPLRNRSKHSTRLVLAVSVMSISMPSQIIPHRQSALASAKIFHDTYWRIYWTAPSVADSLYALRRRTTMTNRANTIRKLRDLSKVTSGARVCPLRRGGCQAKGIWSFRA